MKWEEVENDKPYMAVFEKPEDAADVGENVTMGVYRLERVVQVGTRVVVQSKRGR